jgi:hypothetical protein
MPLFLAHWLERRIHIRPLAEGSSILLPATKEQTLAIGFSLLAS